jgi:aryl-alcohol dehydrogenase-like predicted oxidoreductase
MDREQNLMASSGNSPAEPARAGAACPGGPGLLAGRTVARVGYGAMQLRNLRHDRDAAIALLRRAVELGVNHIDTAHFYGDGLVNELIREAVSADDEVTVVSKVGADPDPGGPYPIRMAQRPGELAASVEANLASLGLGQIPVVNLRRPDASTPVPVADDQVVDLDDQLAAMTALRDAGKIGAIGLSGVTLDELRRALPAGIACVQEEYSLVARGNEDMLRLCTGAGIAWVPYFPLGGALPGSPKVTDQPAVLAAAEALRCTPAQAGLAWLLRHAPNVLLIPGTTSPGHLEENLAAGALTIDTATLAALDAIRATPTRPA